MNSDKHRRVTELFAAALELDPEERAVFLQRECGEDTALRAEVESLLGHHEEDSFLEETVVRSLEPEVPDSIGPYRVLSTLGEGGMGTVYLCEQSEPIARKVAIKVIRLGMGSKEVLARFGLERQALAVLSHPAIAKVHDAGATELGQPYFVMEYVEGTPIHEYCDDQQLGIEERIKLFQQVCHGVEHAHQKGILHRDLKPANILALSREGQHVVKIIDFGLARATDRQLLQQSILTEQGLLLGTPEYMSPEQASGEIASLDTRTDIYSLGVLLYQLLTGELPFESDRLRKRALGEVQRILQEEDPPKPSSKLDSLSERLDASAAKRRVSGSALRRALRGDLDWIVMRAMAKEPERRYASATQLVVDLERYLQHEPVEAGPPSTAYRFAKFIRKFRTQVAALLLVFVTAIVGAIFAWNYAVEARTQTTVAEDRLDNFDRLSAVLKLEAAGAGIDELSPAWPDKRFALGKWIQDHGDPLAAELPRVRDTLARLSKIARPLSDQQKLADRRGHPDYPRFETLTKKVASLQLAMDVRNGTRKVPAISVPADAPKELDKIMPFAWCRVSDDPKERVWGDELLALSLARRADKQRDGLEQKILLAWALFAVGLDEEAKAASLAAIDKTPEHEKVRSRAFHADLEKAIASASTALSDAKAELAKLDAQLDVRRTYVFEKQADAFLHRSMQEVARKLEAFVAEDGELEDMRRRLFWAERIEELTLRHPKAKKSWEEAAAAIAKADDVVASRLYAADKAELRPQTGLVPIGMNPKTKLWEFYHLRSAWDPRSGVDPASIEIPTHRDDGSIALTESTGVVFVLLPSGSFTMGAQASDPNGKNYDRYAEADETPRSADVGQFFMARHELTQAQWLRLSLQDNPSVYRGGVPVPPKPTTFLNPVERVDWASCRDLLRKHGLRLPLEAEWEYACRATTDTVWSTGSNPKSLHGFANVLDRTAKERAPSWRGKVVPFHDGHVIHAAVGSFSANLFGMHDMHGNVWEWCGDESGKERITRGGDFRASATLARSASREAVAPTLKNEVIGLRAARAVLR